MEHMYMCVYSSTQIHSFPISGNADELIGSWEEVISQVYLKKQYSE